MNSYVTSEIKKAYAFIEKQFHQYTRFYAWELVWLVYTVCMALSVGFIGAGMSLISSGNEVNVSEVTIFLLTGSLLWGYLSLIVLETNWMIVMERWEGTIEYTFMAPVSRTFHLIGMSSFSVLYGIVRTGIVLLIVSLFFNLDMSNANMGSAAVVLAIASISFVGFAMLTSVFPLISPEKGQQMVHIFDAVLLMISGVFYPVDVLPGWLQPLSKLSPATYTLEGLRDALLRGTTVREMFVPVIMPLLVLGVVLVPVGLVVFNLAEKHAMRTGKLKRDG